MKFVEIDSGLYTYKINMNRDIDLPNGFQDADLEMRELERSANLASKARKRGVCDHSWYGGPPGRPESPTSVYTCYHCGAVFKTEAELWQSTLEARRQFE